MAERDNLRRAYRHLMEQFELLRRRDLHRQGPNASMRLSWGSNFEKTKLKLDELAAKLSGIDIIVAGSSHRSRQWRRCR